MRNFHRPGRSVAVAEQAMAATSHPAATLAALDVLKAGGNALDAAIAAVALQGVVEPAMTGIGGDCFCLIGRAGQPVVAFNGSGRAPAAATIDRFEGDGRSSLDGSVHAVTLPGAV
ncbi:MAG: gamma-glutamyltransferase, partial [Geminicoccaceae bacterium]|nr:gamma-glutamyltransferase [Geminicoccaceae bacterium]